MTADVDAFRAHLPDDIRPYLAITGRVTGSISRARQMGWTIDQLVREATRDLTTATSAGAVISARLARIVEARIRPPGPPTPARAHHTAPYCGSCDAPSTRWVIDDPDKPARRCHCWTPTQGAL